MGRAMLRIFLTLFAALLGFAAAAMLAVAFLISPHAGLAGGAEVVFYGAAGAVIAGVAAGFMVSRLGTTTLVWAALLAAIIFVTLFARVLWLQQSADDASSALPADPRPVTKPAPDVSR